MTTFDDRERAYEAKFALDEEIAFRVTARRNQLIAQWATKEAGMDGAAAESFIAETIHDMVTAPGDDVLIARLSEALSRDPADVAEALDQALTQARLQVN